MTTAPEPENGSSSYFILDFLHRLGTKMRPSLPEPMQKLRQRTQLIHMLKYKAELVGITVFMTEESYTSKASLLDRRREKDHGTCATPSKEERTMSYRHQPRPEHPSTYFVLDRSNQEELARLRLQDDLMTQGMGGVLPEQPDPASLQRVLDVGCGTGCWLIETARTYPSIKLLIGVDISRTYVEYARAQAEAAHVSDRVEFQMMDALRRLEFPTRFFDLVNHRLATSWLRTWDWPKVLQEYQRVCHPKGVVRITEGDWTGVRSASALSRLFELSVKALSQAGHLFTPTGAGVTGELVRLLNHHGLQQVQTRAFTLEYHAGTPAGQHYVKDNALAFRTMVPFLHKWTHVPQEYENIYQQALLEMQQPDFVATWDMLTVWGRPS